MDDYPGAAAVPPANQVQAAKFHKYALNATMTRLIFGALDSFAEVCDKANITYILDAGSLLGTYRHHGMIPWDMDIDVLISKNDRPKFEKEYKRHGNKSYILIDTSNGMKLYTKNGVESGHSWTAPFLDIFFWDEDEKYIWHGSRDKKNSKKDVFPVVYRPLGKKKYPAPRDPRAFLTNTIGTRRFLGKWVRDFNQANICATGGYDYILGKFKNKSDKHNYELKRTAEGF